MKFSATEMKRAKVKKRKIDEGVPRSRAAVAKRPRPTVGISIASSPPTVSPLREGGDGDDSVEEIPAIPPVPAPSSGPTRIAPSSVVEGVSSQIAARRKGKAPVTSQDQEEEDPEGEYMYIGTQVPKDGSTIRSKGLAEKVLKMTILPKDWEERKSRSLEENIKSFYTGLSKFINDISVVQEGVAGFTDLTRRLQDQADSAKADAEVADELRKAGEEREVQLREELQICRTSHQKEEVKVAKLEERLASTEKELCEAIAELRDADLRRRSAEERVGSLKVELKASKAAAAKILDDFRHSQEYRDEVAESCVDAFSAGFEQCKKKVSDVFPDLDLKDIVESDGEDDASEVEVGAEEVIEQAVADEAEMTSGDIEQRLLEEVTAEVVAGTENITAEAMEDLGELPIHPGEE